MGVQEPKGRCSRGGGRGPWPLQLFEIVGFYRNVNASSENFWIFVAIKDKGFEVYWKIIELGPPTQQVPQAPEEP